MSKLKSLCVPGGSREPVSNSARVARYRLRVFITAALAYVVGMMPSIAHAHVKWFVNYNLMCPPRAPFSLLTSNYFLIFFACVIPLMYVVAFADRRLTERTNAFNLSLDKATEVFTHFLPWIVRLSVAIFFAAIASYGDVILTPELKTLAAWPAIVQTMIAASMVSRRTLWIGAAGIISLYIYGAVDFGLFHMLDYVVFLGVAAFLWLDGKWGSTSDWRPNQRDRAIAILRVATGFSLLWAGTEKFAYPEWSFMLLDDRPELTMGFKPEFFLVAAGFVEVCCAFLVITGLLASRVCALLLFVFMCIGIVLFGMTDLVGHFLILVALIMIMLTRNTVGVRLALPRGLSATAGAHATGFLVLMGVLIVTYYWGHYLSYGY